LGQPTVNDDNSTGTLLNPRWGADVSSASTADQRSAAPFSFPMTPRKKASVTLLKVL
jgi:hypothetical protein